MDLKWKNKIKNNGITLISLIITIIVLLIISGVAINTLYGANGIITTTQDAAVLGNIKNLEEGINLYKVNSNLEGKVEEDSYPIALSEDGSRITLNQMKSSSELAKLPDEVKYTLLNLTSEKGTTNIPSLDQIDYSKFYKLDYTKLNISQEEAENLVIYIDGDDYKVINLSGVKYKKSNVYVIIPLNNEAEPEYITVANNTYKLYGDGTLKVLGEKTTNSGYTNNEINAINYSWDEFDLKAINARFDNRMILPETLTSDWYASHVYFSKGTAYVIDNNNDLWAWGANDYNKLGLGHSFLVVEPTKILEGRCEGKENVKATKVWAGDYNTFIVDTDGNLWACGSNSEGVLGQGNTNIYSKWIQINNINGNDVKEIQLSTTSQCSTAVIILKNGDVYGGGYNVGTIGSSGDKLKFTLISSYNNANTVELGGGTTLCTIDKNGTLYGNGSYHVWGNTSPDNTVKVSENVKQVKTVANSVLYITNDNKLYLRKTNKQIINLENSEFGEDIVLAGWNGIISNGVLYSVNVDLGVISKIKENAQPYYNQYDEYNFIQNKVTLIYKDGAGKIFIRNQPNITKLGEKSNYNLRKVFENAVFVQGKGSYISIVNRERKIYESTNSTANEKINDAKKIISSQMSKYVVKTDGTLWAKGNERTGMWGEYSSRSDYIQVTKDGINNFTNVKEIYTSKFGSSAIFTTEDNKIYWAGIDGYIVLPKITGDVYIVGNGNLTNYPKEVSSDIIEEVRNKIKDIQYASNNYGGVRGQNTLLLTEDGKLYTMSTNKNMSGNNTATNNGSGDFTELTIKEGATVKQILTEDGLSLALLSTGEVYGWGYNTYGILGQKYEVGEIYPTPVKLEGLPDNIRYMSLGNGFAIFASKSGEVYGIGKNDYGQLGTGDNIGRTEFVRCTKLEE